MLVTLVEDTLAEDNPHPVNDLFPLVRSNRSSMLPLSLELKNLSGCFR
jgi:hypothetical protein